MSRSQTPAPATQPGAPARPAKRAASAPRQAAVLVSLRHLEPWVAWSVALYTAVVAIVAYRDLTWMWLFVVYAALVGQWAQRYPARHPLQLFLRGLALLAAAFVLLSQSAVYAGQNSGLLFFWVSVPALCYAFLLPAGWNGAVLALALFTAVVASLDPAGRASWEQVFTQCVFLCVFTPLVAMRFGAAMRRTGLALEESLRDGTTGLHNRAGLLLHGEELAAACLAERQPVTLVLFDAHGMLDPEMLGRGAVRELLLDWVRLMGMLSGERGLAARTGPTEFALLLPGTTPEKTSKLLERAFGDPPRLSVKGEDGESVLEPTVAVLSVTDAARLGDLVSSLERRLGIGDSQFAGLDEEPGMPAD